MIKPIVDLEYLFASALLGLEHEEEHEKVIEAYKNIKDSINEYELIKKKLKQWHCLLGLDGGNTKHQVLVDIEQILNKEELE